MLSLRMRTSGAQMTDTTLCTSEQVPFLAIHPVHSSPHRPSYGRRALRLALDALPPTVAFNIVSFGSEFSRLFCDAQPASAANIAAAKAHVAALESNYGASDLWRPLQALLLLAEHPGDEPRTIRQV